VLTEGVLLAKASEEADIPAERVPVKHSLILARSADCDIELLNAAGVVRGRRSGTNARRMEQLRELLTELDANPEPQD
jgi:hypothetical protein